MQDPKKTAGEESASKPVLNPPELIPFNKILPSPANPRKSKDADIKSLQDSIRAQGLLHPIIVRHHPSKPGYYEIITGERRWRAIQGLWLTIPAVIRELSDQEAHEITVVENMQREDLAPMEEAAGIQTLLDQGKDAREIADRLGKPVGWVLRRAKLQNLSAKWRKALQNGDYEAKDLSGSHLELIARLDHDIQDRILEECDFYGESVEDVRKQIEQQYMRNLAQAPWKIDEPILFFGKDQGGSLPKCSECPKRTSIQADLFDDLAQKKGPKHPVDHCLDKECWRKKHQAFIERKAAQLREENPKLLFIGNGSGILPQGHELQKEKVRDYEYTTTKKTDKKALPALIIDGPGAGTTTWIRPMCEKEPLTVGGKKTMKEKKAGLEKRRTIAFIGKVLEITEKFEKNPEIHGKFKLGFVIELLSRFGADPLNEVSDFLDCADAFETRKIGHDWQTILRCVIPKIEAALRGEMQVYEPERDNTKKVCKWLCIDDKALVAQVEKEIPVPKAWGEQKKPAERKCRICGCTENNCKKCIEKTGKPCHWIEDDLCSACAPAKKSEPRKEGRGLSALIGSKKKTGGGAGK